MNVKAIITIVTTVVICISLTPVIFSAIYTDTIKCLEYNTTQNAKDCNNAYTVNADFTLASFCQSCITGTAKTLMTLIPFIYVGIVVVGGLVAGYIAFKS